MRLIVSYERQPKPPSAAYNPLPPDLAVEVVSPSDAATKMRIKINNYTHAGTTLWLADPQRQTVEIYALDAPTEILHITNILNGGSILPGFELPVKAIFPSRE